MTPRGPWPLGVEDTVVDDYIWVSMSPIDVSVDTLL